MPLRKLTGRARTNSANWQLASLLAFTAGVVDISGYLALRQFTSHMSGIVSGLAANTGTHHYGRLFQPFLVLVCFLAGAAFCAILVNWERRRDRESLFAVPMLLEALLLASLALPFAPRHAWITPSVMGFSMGLQNAIITKISRAEIRTTHVTGIVTDIGIELGKALYWNRSPQRSPVRAERQRLLLLTALASLFFTGGVTGALAYPRIGFLLMLPLAILLALPTILPIAADVRAAAMAR